MLAVVLLLSRRLHGGGIGLSLYQTNVLFFSTGTPAVSNWKLSSFSKVGPGFCCIVVVVLSVTIGAITFYVI